MYLRRTLHFFTCVLVLLGATVCPLPHVLCEGWLDDEVAYCIKKRQSKIDPGFYILRFLKKIFNKLISSSFCLSKSPNFIPSNNFATLSLASLSSTILLL